MTLDFSDRTFAKRKELYHIVSEKGAKLRIFDVKGTKLFMYDNIIHSELDNNSVFTHAYFDYFVPLPLLYKKPKILLIGLGGGTIPYQFSKLYRNGFSMDVVEPDKDIIKMSKRFLPRGTARFKTIVSDGAKYVKSTKNKYDIIIQDAFIGLNVPKSLMDRNFIDDAHRALKSNGVLAINYASNVYRLPFYVHRLKKMFNTYMIRHIVFGNYIIICAKRMHKGEIVNRVVPRLTRTKHERFLADAYGRMETPFF